MENLSRMGIEVFLPRIQKPAAKPGRLMEPLFPTYLFCRLDPLAPVWPMARWSHGLKYFLSADDQPSPVSEHLVDYLKDQVDRWNSGNIPRHIRSGDRVEITSGPFAGLEGLFQNYIPSRQRCLVLLEVVGRLSTVELSEWMVRATSAKSNGLSLATV